MLKLPQFFVRKFINLHRFKKNKKLILIPHKIIGKIVGKIALQCKRNVRYNSKRFKPDSIQLIQNSQFKIGYITRPSSLLTHIILTIRKYSIFPFIHF